jgi:exopolysaccharide biosynthesis polyprenyl glycosylphosphotransferase
MHTEAAEIRMERGAIGYPSIPSLSLKFQRLALKTWLILTDAIALAVAFKVAFWIRFDLRLTTAPEVVPYPDFYPNLASVLIPIWILAFMISNLYHSQAKIGGIAEYARVFNACTTSSMILVLIAFFEQRFAVSRVWLVFSWLLSFLLVSMNRFLNRRLVYCLRRRGYFLVPAAIIGTNQESLTLAEDLGEWPFSGLRILGFISSQDSDTNRPQVKQSYPELGTVTDIQTLIQEYEIEDIIVASTALNREELLRLGEEVNANPNVNLRLSSGLYELFTTGVTVRRVGTVPLLSVNKIRLESEEVYVKWLMDYALTLFALSVLWPVFLLIAVCVKLDSPGPVFHRRKVLGMSGMQFDALKFRTMFVNGDEQLKDRPELLKLLQVDHKLKEDPRITRLGAWLRKYSLDELPQLFNILLGQMSLVGPRMITAAEAEKYGRRKLNLMTVKPGVTGLWQVSGRSDLSYEERVRLDMYYIRNYSLWMDLQILFVQTIPAVIRGRGAY